MLFFIFSNPCSSDLVSQHQNTISLDCDHRCRPFFPCRPLVISYYPGAHNICVQVSFSSLSFNWVLADLIFLCPLALFFSPGVVTICLHLCCPPPIPPSSFWGLKQHSPWFLIIATLSSLCPAPPCSLPFANLSQRATFDVSWHAVLLHYWPTTLHEMLATANMIPDLPMILDTTDVIVDISHQPLRVASLIHEYMKLSPPGDSLP